MSIDGSTQGTACRSSDADQERIVQILDDYMVATERGEAVSPTQLLAQHPNDAPQLKKYLSGLKLLQNVVAKDVDLPLTSEETGGDPHLGQRIGDYQIVREVGRGGMGVVYEAQQLSLMRRVALKVLPRFAAYDEIQLHRFRIESTAAASIEHPNIVPVFAIGEERGVHFYAMQFIDGESLADLIGGLRGDSKSAAFATTAANDFSTSRNRPSANRSPSPVGQELNSSISLQSRPLRDHLRTVAEFGIQAADALHAAHSYGVVHRDVKPSNFLIDEKGKLWIADFGLARRREGSDLTQTGDILGTLRYMSPEQGRGQGHLVDHRTDVYSLGVTLYEAACLQHPKGGESAGAVLHDRHQVKPLRQVDRRIPADLETINMKSVAESPVDRYSTAESLADDLRRFVAGEPILARPPGLFARISKWTWKRRRIVAVAAAALVVALAAVSTALVVVAREKAVTDVHLGRARDNLQQTRNVLDELGSQLAEQLAAIPHAEGIRYQLLHKSLEYYRQIARQGVDDPTLALDVALAYSKIGELTERLGDPKVALSEHQQARDLLEQQLRRSPSNPVLLRSLAVSLNNIGSVLNALGQDDRAISSCQRALRIQERLLLATPDSIELLTDQAACYSNLGVVHKIRGEVDEAAAAFANAEQLHRRLEYASPSEDARRRRALGYLNLASISESD